ncbi:MAG TPA: acetate/propionate family kinase [Nitrospira sp.]|nr:acetate/propionate family kinase [Nitrospira sp.]
MMAGSDPVILTINGGSSSIRFALFGGAGPPARVAGGKIDRIGLPGSTLTVAVRDAAPKAQAVEAPDHGSALSILLTWMAQSAAAWKLRAVGHRIVHGGTRYVGPERVTSELLEELRRISPYDPEHMPAEIGLVETFHKLHPSVPQFACFDTAFHRDLPRVARLLPIPRRYDRMGIRRYGFHGLSYSFLMRELTRVGHPGEAEGRIILAHLGNGASMTAVRKGKSVDTTMAFTPTSGLPMSRRSGDLDPGLVSYLASTEAMTVEEFHHMVNAESGLLGLSETSPDVRDLLAKEGDDPRAAEALALFCHQARKAVGALTATLGGLDTLVFSGGIGENAPAIRERICQGLGFLGIAIDEGRNRTGEPVLSPPGAPVTVRMIRTDEEIEIAEAVHRILNE